MPDQEAATANPQTPDPAALLLRIERLEALVASLLPRQAPIQARPSTVLPPNLTPPIPSPRQFAAYPTPSSPPRTPSLETQLGARVLSKVAVILLLIGTAWFLKWAFDNRWIGPTGRVVAGLLVGAGVVFWSERFRRQSLAGFSYALKAVGSGVLYLSLWAGFQVYHLMPASVALFAMTAVTACNAYLAYSQDAELLAGFALLGGYLTPILLSTGGNHEVFLFTYLFVFASALLALLVVKPWSRLLLGAFPVTVFYFIAWYSLHFTAPETHITLFFSIVLWLPFAAVPLLARDPEGPIAGVLTPLFAAAFGALAVYSVLADGNGTDLEPWAAVAFAAIYLALTRLRRSGVASAVHLSLGIVFLTIAIPLKATGRAITAGWLVESVALLWVASLPNIDRRANVVLRWLAFSSLLLGVSGALIGPYIHGAGQASFLNRNFATSLGAIVILAIAMALAPRLKPLSSTALTGEVITVFSLICLNIVLLAAMHLEIFAAFENNLNAAQALPQAHRAADFAFSGWMMFQGAALLAIGFWKRLALPRWLGLILLAATVIKAFAYDMRNLDTGYRVISYFALGIVLMAVSFAYQKDWLKLGEDDTTEAAQ